MYPRCTNSLGLFGESDCGSVGWAFTLFIAWNILSMVSGYCPLYLNYRADCFFAVHLRQSVHWCGCREFLLCLPNDWWCQIDYSRRNPSLQESMGWVCQSHDWLLGTHQCRPLLWRTAPYVPLIDYNTNIHIIETDWNLRSQDLPGWVQYPGIVI